MGIYLIDRDLAAEYARLDKLEEKARETIKDFVDEIKITGITKYREYFYLVRLRIIYSEMQDKFLNPDKKSIIEMLLKFKERYSDATFQDYEQVIKRFYKWKLGTVPDYIANLKFGHKASHDRKIDLITRGDIDKMVDSCTNSRDKAFVSILYDSGCRIGEILSLRISDVRYDEYGAILNVHGKTGNRSVRIIGNSIAYLREYLKSKDDKDEFLFTGMKADTMHKQMQYTSARKILLSLKARAGIEKKIYAHLFRHTRASMLASKVPEAPLENQMGWIHGSKMTGVYVHLSMRDQDNAILKAYGVKVSEEENITEEKPKKCPRCEHLNASTALYCTNCFMPFDEKLALEYEGKEKEIVGTLERSSVVPGMAKSILEKAPDEFKGKLIENILEQILKNPEMLSKLRNEIKNGMEGENLE